MLHRISLSLGAACLLAATPLPAQAAPPPARPAGGSAAPARTRPVLPGVQVLLRDSLQLVRGRRVGLITNHTAVIADGRSAIDLLAESPDVRLVALYAPEHGIRGVTEGGSSIADGRDARTGLPIFSLYGKTQKPTTAMLRGVNVLLFDMQDIGARPYTYVWTMAMAMEAAAAHHIPFVVLDRPNPITGASQGPLMAMEMRNKGQAITGYYPVPLRHGMTAGEVARYVNGEFHVGADLRVVPIDGWTEDRWFDDTGLPWINPSPNIRSLDAALHYSGLVMLETVNLSVGRGTDAPFSYVGAPWLNHTELARRLARYEIPGVRITPVTYVPRGGGWVPFRGETVRGIHLQITDRQSYQPVLLALAILSETYRMHPQQLGMGSMLQMLGSRWAPEAVRRGDDPRAINRRWEEELAGWRAVRDRYRLYPESDAPPDSAVGPR